MVDRRPFARESCFADQVHERRFLVARVSRSEGPSGEAGPGIAGRSVEVKQAGPVASPVHLNGLIWAESDTTVLAILC